MVLPARSAPIASLGTGKARVGLAVRALPVAWASPKAAAAAIGHRTPLGSTFATWCPLTPLRRRRGIRACASSRLAAFERGEAVHKCIELRLRWTAELAIRRHGLLRVARWALGRMVRTQRARRVGEA